MTSRRRFLETSALSAIGATVIPAVDRTLSAHSHADDRQSTNFINVVRPPDLVMAQLASSEIALTKGANDSYSNNGITVVTTIRDNALRIELSSPSTAIKRVHLRWRGSLRNIKLTLGDAWERAYGDLEWRSSVPDRVMPWYTAMFDGTRTNCYGVRTGASAFCFWQSDAQGLSLIADVRAGGVGVQLGNRSLHVCDVICRAGDAGENSFAALHAFCKQMCPDPRIPPHPVYGSNDWYWVYGKNSAESVMTDTRHIVELSPTGSNRPYAVIDDGWQPGRGREKTGVGTWDHGNDKFPDMPALVSEMKKAGARPGVWIRPLQATADAAESWRLPRDRNYFDPTVPDVLQKITDDMARLTSWGFELIKHDYSTFDIFGRWGAQMGAAMTRDNWTFAAGPSRTTAEVINALYRTIRAASGDALIIGCNTVSHLSAGHFDICRIGDDTSGTEWPRTRKMGVNTLAFRGVQHSAFYVADADCVGVTNAIPWSLNRQWLDVLSRSGTTLFVSLDPVALGAEQRRDLTDALARAATSHALAEPVDWQTTVYPTQWRMADGAHTYDWTGADGAGMP